MINTLISDRKQLFLDELRSFRARPVNPIRNNLYHKTGTISRKSRQIYPRKRLRSYGISNIFNIISNNINPIDFQLSIHYEEKIIKLEPKYRIKYDIKTLHSLHDELTDKKILGTITLKEEIKLEHIRNELESQENISRIDFYKTKIDKYQEILNKINELENLLK